MKRKGKLFVVPFLMAFMLVAVGCEDKYVAKGHKAYSRYCAPCHGDTGNGSGYNAKNMDPVPRDLTDGDEDYMAKLSNDEIFEVLQLGGYGVDLSGGMPVWGKVFSEEELWSLVAYVRTLHPNEENEIVFTKPDSKEALFNTKRVRYPMVREQKFDELLESLAPDEEAFDEQVAVGEEIYAEVGCNACHRVNGEGGTLGPNLSAAGFMLQPQFIFRWIMNPQSFVPKTRMPNLDLNEADALAISLYVSTLKEASLQNEVLQEDGDAEDGDAEAGGV